MKILKVVFIVVGVLVAALVGGEILENLQTKGYFGPNKLGVEKKYLGVALGGTRQDVLFALGKPTNEIQTANGDNCLIFWIKNGDGVGVAKLVIIGKSDGVVKGVEMSASKNARNELSPLKWIDSEITPEELVARLGEPDAKKIIDDGVSQVYRYNKYNLAIGFEQKRVYSIGITELPVWPIGVLNWDY